MDRTYRVTVVGLAILFALAIVTLFAGASKAENLQRLRDQVLSMTAQLDENCSATLVSSERDEKSGEVETLFLTAKHCVRDDDRDMVIDLPIYQNSRVVKKDRYIAIKKNTYYKGDLALVELKDKQTFFENVAKVAPKDGVPSMGAHVWTVGYPFGLQLTITEGMFGARETFNFPKPGTEYFRATPDVVGGNSGGAMYRINAKGDYELIGVTSAGHRTYSFLALYVPLDMIRDYLRIYAPSAVGEGAGE